MARWDSLNFVTGCANVSKKTSAHGNGDLRELRPAPRGLVERLLQFTTRCG
jgi:hypothetical protein